jgi:phosphoserine phosphatase
VTDEGDLSIPLCVDLDGTLIVSDLLWEAQMQMLKHNPLSIVSMGWWVLRGRAALKRQTALRVKLDAAALAVHEGFLQFLREEKARGRRLVLATASDAAVVAPVAAHFGVFDEVLASDGKRNLRGATKAAVLTELYGPKGFDYAGNSHMDLPVWAAARKAIVVNATEALTAKARALGNVVRVFPPERTGGFRVPWSY